MSVFIGTAALSRVPILSRSILTLIPILSVTISCLAYPQVSSAEDAQAGRVKAEVACQTCHGIDGLATLAMVPNIAGQREDYTVIQLEAYRSGKRQHPQMSIIAQSLSDQDIRNLAAWYASIKISVTVPDQ